MASLTFSSSSSSQSLQEQWRYDVFLSFRGEDTRNNFTSHLYKELCRNGIVTFKDDRELKKGLPIPQQVPKAIQDSRILVIIFSKNYSASSWCLNELVKIFECMKAGRQLVLPIFYNVSPSEVRKQNGEFGQPFAKYETLSKDDIQVQVQQWRVASTELSNLSGWHLNDRDESEFIQDIVENILCLVRRTNYSVAKNFVGIDSRSKQIKDYLDLGQLNKVQIIGLSGIGGVGKTALASVVYEEIYCQFEGCCFLKDVRESIEKYGIVSLQKQLLSAILHKDIPVYDVYKGIEEIRNKLRPKKILVILDDVDQLEQLELLIGTGDGHWFGSGSRIIITTRDEHLLRQHGVNEIYKVLELNDDDSFKLFCSKAFKNNSYKIGEEYMELCNEFVKYAGGLPLALNVLGSSLYGKLMREWRSTLDRLKEIPNEKILSKLQISYDGLDKVSQNIFLDIACFFKGMEEDYVIKVLECRGFFPNGGIGELIDKSLITVSCGYVRMHDLVVEMGREIVRKESFEDPGLRSRIWLDKEVYRIQRKNMEMKQVKALVLNSWKLEEECLRATIFTKMKELRLLILRDIPVSHDVEYLPNELRYLEWHKYPFKSFPSSFQPDEIVQLYLQFSNLEQLWKRSIKPIKSLKIIDLSYSRSLVKTPDFREVPNLEELHLKGCVSLREVHQSVGVLKKLNLLNLKRCINLVTLPNSICNLKSLKTLILHSCSKLKKLPDKLENMTSLVELDVVGIGEQQMGSGFRFLSWLMPWTVKNRHPTVMLFPSLSTLCLLNYLDLSYCNLSDEAIPGDLSGLPMLEYLNLRGNNIVSLPSSIGHLSRLYVLRLCNCKRLKSLENLPSNILYLSTYGCSSLKPSQLTRHYKLENLCFPNCARLQSMHGSSSTLFNLIVEVSTCQTPPEKEDLIQSHFTLVNRIQLVEVQHGNCTASTRLTTYLHFLLKHSSQGLLNHSHISMCLSGDEVPEWFDYRGKGSSMEVQLPPYWLYNNWSGFVICAVSEGCVLPFSERVSIFCDFMSDQQQFLGRFSAELSGNPMVFNINKIWVNYIRTVSLNFSDCWEATNKIKMSFFSNGLKVKYCGLRVLREHDIIESFQCKRLGNSSLPCDTSKRSHDSSCGASNGELNNGDNIVKKMKMSSSC